MGQTNVGGDRVWLVQMSCDCGLDQCLFKRIRMLKTSRPDTCPPPWPFGSFPHLYKLLPLHLELSWRSKGRELCTIIPGDVILPPHNCVVHRLQNKKQVWGVINWGPAPQQEVGSTLEKDLDKDKPTVRSDVRANSSLGLRLGFNSVVLTHFWQRVSVSLM